METVLLTIHAIVAVALIAVIMLQRSEGGALGIGGGSGNSMFTARGTANALTRMTTILGASFIVTSLALAVVSNEKRDNTSVLDKVSVEETATSATETSKQDGTQVPVSQ